MQTLQPPPAPAPKRTHVTLEYTGTWPVMLPKVPTRDSRNLLVLVAHELRLGDNTIPLAYWHAVGGSEIVQRLVGAGVLAPVCREHIFDERNDLAQGGPVPVFCLNCGHSPESAAS